jgi:UDP-N-acetylmuramyl pentapeptide phosphotransferase/UDP-N-acetylglucosamine-1-phosphate transferase
MDNIDAMRIFMPAVSRFFLGLLSRLSLTYFFYKFRFWKPKAGKIALDGTQAETFNKLHEHKEVGTPRAGGILVWGSTLLTAGLLSLLSSYTPEAFGSLAFISREQTWLPLSALVVGSFVGLLDDYYEVRGKGGLAIAHSHAGRCCSRALLRMVVLQQTRVSAISFPFVQGPLELGILFIPFL